MKKTNGTPLSILATSKEMLTFIRQYPLTKIPWPDTHQIAEWTKTIAIFEERIKAVNIMLADADEQLRKPMKELFGYPVEETDYLYIQGDSDVPF